MAEERRFPLWLRYPLYAAQVAGLYLAIYTAQKLLGVVLIAGGMFLVFYIAVTTKPQGNS